MENSQAIHIKAYIVLKNGTLFSSCALKRRDLKKKRLDLLDIADFFIKRITKMKKYLVRGKTFEIKIQA